MTATVPGTREFVCLSICLYVSLSVCRCGGQQRGKEDWKGGRWQTRCLGVPPAAKKRRTGSKSLCWHALQASNQICCCCCLDRGGGGADSMASLGRSNRRTSWLSACREMLIRSSPGEKKPPGALGASSATCCSIRQHRAAGGESPGVCGFLYVTTNNNKQQI
jgi:hypothetical protein